MSLRFLRVPCALVRAYVSRGWGLVRKKENWNAAPSAYGLHQRFIPVGIADTYREWAELRSLAEVRLASARPPLGSRDRSLL